MLAELSFPHASYLVQDVRMADILLASLVYLPCLREEVLRAYCTFASKQAISITVFGPRPNNNRRLRTNVLPTEEGYNQAEFQENIPQELLKCLKQQNLSPVPLLPALQEIQGNMEMTCFFETIFGTMIKISDVLSVAKQIPGF